MNARNTISPEPTARSGAVLAFPRVVSSSHAGFTDHALGGDDSQLLEELRRFLSKSRLVGGWRDSDRYKWRQWILEASTDEIGVRLFHALGRSTKKTLEFYHTRCGRASVDEIWLIRLIRAAQADDAPSIAALIGFRVARAWRLRIRGLVFAIARRIPTAEIEGPGARADLFDQSRFRI